MIFETTQLGFNTRSICNHQTNFISFTILRFLKKKSIYFLSTIHILGRFLLLEFLFTLDSTESDTVFEDERCLWRLRRSAI